MIIDASIRTAIRDFRQGRIDAALSRLDALSPEKRTPYFYKIRGAIRLTVGRVALALQDIHALLANNPNDAEALALQSVLALTQNRKDEAYALANRAISSDSRSSTAYSALSYAEQGRFELDKALEATDQAVKYAPHDAMVWARKAELELALGLISESGQSAQHALKLDANLERTQTVMGFSYLLRMDTDEALQAFEKAVKLDSTSPLARLGLGLAKIRSGDLEKGRQNLEIAAILDPDNSLIRSYLGKAYHAEKRNVLAEGQFNLAKERDPKDPTPYFYDALKKQTENRPVEALQNLQKAIELNDNRAVYRSKLLLDADRASREASLARIYDNLGFEQRGLVEATSSLQIDPTNFSAHRFLADTYVNQSSRETAQLSELLQAKLLQPVNINPVQPHLSVSQRGLLNALGIANSSFQDFTRTFEGNRPQLIVSGVGGNLGTFGDEVTLSGLVDKFSYSLGQYHYQTDGFIRPYGPDEDRKNTDQRHDIYDAFLQWAINDRLNTQFEFVHRETQQGNLIQKLNSIDTTFPDRNFLREKTYRAGINLRVFTDDHLLASYVHNDSFTYIDQLATESPGKFTNDNRDSIDFYEGQYLHHTNLYNLITGFSAYTIKDFIPSKNMSGGDDGRNGHREYTYVNLKLPARITGTLGLTYDFSDAKNQPDIYPNGGIYPKAGLLWDIGNRIKLRFAYIRENKRPIAAIQTIEPTQIAGFNQFFDDLAEKKFSFYGGAVDMVIQPNLFAGVEFSRRDVFNLHGGDLFFQKDSSKVYINWAPLEQLAITARYNYIRKYSPESSVLSTHIVPLEFRYFHPSGFFGKLIETYVHQALDKINLIQVNPNASNFFLLDASIGFRFPKRLGIISIEGRNLLNKKYRFEDLSGDENNQFFNPSLFIPERTIFGRITLNF
ncbi:MAG: tetratricopeptide repeat protein [Methylococcales bacterium]|nr:tetratricopeptide repeat protein [Methylococcales bacterium]